MIPVMWPDERDRMSDLVLKTDQALPGHGNKW